MVRKRRDSSNFEQTIRNTDNMFVKCTSLPDFIRAKKRLPHAFCVFFDKSLRLKDGIEVKLEAKSSKNSNGELRNNVTLISNNKAHFEDLRFLGKSGRGKIFLISYFRFNVHTFYKLLKLGTRFDIIISVQSEPVIVAKYSNAIKVSVDGPRSPRKKYHQENVKFKRSLEHFNNTIKSDDLQTLAKSSSSSYLSSTLTEPSSIITEFEDYFRSLAVKYLNLYLEYHKCKLTNQNIFDLLINLILENAHSQMLSNLFFEYDYSSNYNYFLNILIPLISNQN
jgi:hypothetical protein